MHSEEIEELKAKRMCSTCVGERYLSEEICAKGEHAKCSYCGKKLRCYSIGDIAERIETAFEQHYFRTPDQPTDWDYMYTNLGDRESNYGWQRHGEPVVDAIK